MDVLSFAFFFLLQQRLVGREFELRCLRKQCVMLNDLIGKLLHCPMKTCST
jgi:hypothetical protein